MKNKLIIGAGLLLASPLLALAQGVRDCASFANQGVIESVICRIGGILNTLIPIVIVLGVLYFVWGVITYVIASDEEAKTSGRQRMIYGIIGLVVIVGLWGIVRIVTRTFSIEGNQGPTVTPCVPGTPGCI